MADENFPPSPIPPDVNVSPPVDDPRVNLELHLDVHRALVAQAKKDFDSSTQIDRLKAGWATGQKLNMREVRYQTIAGYQARKARELKEKQ